MVHMRVVIRFYAINNNNRNKNDIKLPQPSKQRNPNIKIFGTNFEKRQCHQVYGYELKNI